LKKINLILIAFILISSNLLIISSSSANNDYSKKTAYTFADYNWTKIDDFFDEMHGHIRIYGNVYGYNDSDPNSEYHPLNSASVSIRSIDIDSNFYSYITDSKMTKVNKIGNNTIYINSSWGDPSDWFENSFNISDFMNFSSSKISKNSCDLYKPYFVKYVKMNPASSIDDFNIKKFNSFISYWRHDFTDENGEYEFKFLQSGTYEISVNRYGYHSDKKIITIGEGSEKIDFILKKKDYMEVCNSIINPFNESINCIREISTYFTTNIDKAIINGTVGCEIVIEDDLNSHFMIYSEGLTINATNITKNKISIIINGEEDITGKTIVVNVEDEVFNNSDNLTIEYDGEQIKMADDLEDVLNPDNDGSNPEYLIIKGANGTQIIVSIPHFSEHEISIFGNNAMMAYPTNIIKDTKNIKSNIFLMIALYALISVVAAIIFIGTIGIRKRFR